MKFVDECRVKVVGGAGGNGAVAFRREKFVPRGGPSGGDGGKGGDVIFEGDSGMSTLMDFVYQPVLEGARGAHGQGKDMYGRAGEDRVCRVPLGTEVVDADTGDTIGEVLQHGERLVVAKGGSGGRGNMHFATPYDRAPRRAEPGMPGEERNLRLQLMVLADVGLLGFPNVGKSTLIRTVSKARPRVADFPFTTLHPHLGIVSVGAEPDATRFALADIPGLIPGASDGAGLGIRFLKHLERTRAIIHLITVEYGEDRDPMHDYDALRTELEKFDPRLASRPEIVVLSKIDLPHVREALPALQAAFDKRGIQLRAISAAALEGTKELMQETAVLVQQLRNEPSPAE